MFWVMGPVCCPTACAASSCGLEERGGGEFGAARDHPRPGRPRDGRSARNALDPAIRERGEPIGVLVARHENAERRASERFARVLDVARQSMNPHPLTAIIGSTGDAAKSGIL